MIWFVALFALTLLIGMTPMEISAGLLSLAALYGIWERKSQGARVWSFYFTGFDWIFALWIAVVTAGFAIHYALDANTAMRILEFKWIIFLYLLTFVLVRSRLTEDIIPWISVPVGAAGIYTIVLSLIAFDPIKGETLDAVVEGGLARSGGLYSHAMTLAHCYGLILCWFFGLSLIYLRYRDRKAGWLLFALIFLGLGVLVTFTRGMWGAVALAFLIMTFIFSRRLGVLFLFLGVLSFGAMYEFWPSFQGRMDQSFSSTGYDSERVWIWKANWAIFRDHPILGVGYAENEKLMPEYFQKIGAPSDTLVSHAHNQYLHFLAGTGALGLLMYLLVLGLFLRLSFKTWREIPTKNIFHKGLNLGLIGAQFAMIFGGLTEANFEHAKVKYVLVMTWAMVLWLAYEYRVLRERI
jgi:O-antigen ligase